MISEGYIPVVGGNVWYRIAGAVAGIPLILIHGGPGYAHNYLKPLEELSDARPVVFYDQLGCGRSDRPDSSNLWEIGRFRDELHQLRTTLGLDKVHVFGHSWGTILAVEYALAYPEIVQSLILASPCLSTMRWIADALSLIKLLPEHMQRVIEKHSPSEMVQSEEYSQAVKEYERRHLCRLDPLPLPMQESKANTNESIYMAMWGSNEFSLTGSLKGYDCTKRLRELSCPVLLTCGRHDEATPQATSWYGSLISRSEVVVFEYSAHMPHLEEPESYLNVMRNFLSRTDSS